MLGEKSYSPESIYCVNPHIKHGGAAKGAQHKKTKKELESVFFDCVFSVIILPLHHCDLPLNIFAISAHNKHTNMNLSFVSYF